MRRSLSNPRILLFSLFAVALFVSVIWAYVERPRLQVSFGGIGDTIPVRQSEFNSADVRSVHFRSELEKRLKSTGFLKALRAKDIRQPPFFQDGTQVVVRHLAAPGLDITPFAAELSEAVSDACKPRELEFMVGFSDQSDIYVMYLFLESYGVYQPANQWIRWLQARLPGMPDTAELAIEAEAANNAVKDDVGRLVRTTIQGCALSVSHGE